MASLLDYTKNLKNQGQFFNKLSQKNRKGKKTFLSIPGEQYYIT